MSDGLGVVTVISTATVNRPLCKGAAVNDLIVDADYRSWKGKPKLKLVVDYYKFIAAMQAVKIHPNFLTVRMQPITPEDWAFFLRKTTIKLSHSQLQTEWDLVAKTCIDKTWGCKRCWSLDSTGDKFGQCKTAQVGPRDIRLLYVNKHKP
jgi:hypothetical protein